MGPVRYFPATIAEEIANTFKGSHVRGCRLSDAVPENGWGPTVSERIKIQFSGGAVVHTLSGMGISNLALFQIFNGLFASYRLLLGTESPLVGPPPPSMKRGAAIRTRPGRQIVQATQATVNTTSRICPFSVFAGPMAARTDRRIRWGCRVRRGEGIGDEEPSPANETQARTPTAPPEGSSIWQQFEMMRHAFVDSPVLKPILWLAAGSSPIIIATAIGQIVLNRWYRPSSTRSSGVISTVLLSAMLFVLLAGVLLVFNVAQQWLNQMVRLKLREGLTLD